MAACVGPPATIRCEPRQVRKEATVATDSGAGVCLMQDATPQVFQIFPVLPRLRVVMAYLVLARKWRPRNFSEMVGQEPVLRALIHALDSGRLHHAFLFTGTRGVGKTTIARILAKSLNCEQGVSSQPCGACPACREIDEGRFVDLIEVDAASRTGVSETRELLENVQYTPTRGRYKVYLIDEVHMFSNHSFNALLKTLEEPPPHVKFLLATTDPQKLPATILSRCLQFTLRRLPLEKIRDQMAYILDQEGIPREMGALMELARAADGSMRDGLSLLDQAIAYGGGRVEEAQVYAMLGTLSRDRVYALLEGLIAGDGQQLLAIVDELAQQSPDWGALLGELLVLLQRIALAQWVPGGVDEGWGDGQRIAALAQRIAPEDIQLYYQIALIGRRDLPLAPQPRGGFEMVLLRLLAFRPGSDPLVSSAPVNQGARISAPATSPPPLSQPATPPPLPSGKRSENSPPVVTTPLAQLDWAMLVGGLNLKGATQQLALNCALERVDGNTLRLYLDPTQRVIHSKERERLVEVAVQERLGTQVQIAIRLSSPGDGGKEKSTNREEPSISSLTPAQEREQQRQNREIAARQAIETDPQVRALRETFDAQLDPHSVRPISPTE